MKKKILTTAAVLLAVICIAGAGLYIAGGSHTPKAASGLRKLTANVSEAVARGIGGIFKSDNNYVDYEEFTPIPETLNGYVPQGYCQSETLGAYVISYYHESKASVLSFVDFESCSRIKTLTLRKSDGKPFTGHAGGVAADNGYLYLCDGNKIFRTALRTLSACADGEAVLLTQYITVSVKCSYLNCDGKYLYAGEFYTYYPDNRYGTDKAHHVQVTPSEIHFSRANAYALENIAALFESGETATPEFILTTPNLVQGLARLPDGTFALSTSYGRNTDSHLLYFQDVTALAPDFTEENIPVYCLTKERRLSEKRLPPLLEGIDVKDGIVTGIFESGAQKFGDGKFPVNSICRFER